MWLSAVLGGCVPVALRPSPLAFRLSFVFSMRGFWGAWECGELVLYVGLFVVFLRSPCWFPESYFPSHISRVIFPESFVLFRVLCPPHCQRPCAAFSHIAIWRLRRRLCFLGFLQCGIYRVGMAWARVWLVLEGRVGAFAAARCGHSSRFSTIVGASYGAGGACLPRGAWLFLGVGGAGGGCRRGIDGTSNCCELCSGGLTHTQLNK